MSKYTIPEEVLKEISEYIEGTSSTEVFQYRTGGQIIHYLNMHFSPGIDWPQKCSRWVYANLVMEKMLDNGTIDQFFSKLLSADNLRTEHPEASGVKIAQLREKGIDAINAALLKAGYALRKNGQNLRLIRRGSDLKTIGEGGFAEVYKILGTNKVLKKLKDEHKTRPQVVSRFKREFELISETLADIPGVIKGFEYDEKEVAYTMEFCETDLKKFIDNNPLTDNVKILIFKEILAVMKKVHERDVIHRDISPKNIFLKDNRIVIADFGLGKDLQNGRTLNTYDTAWQGTLDYCDPILMSSMKKATKQSDIYSLGKLLNFIFKGNSSDDDHVFRSVSKRATSANLSWRYKSVEEMLSDIDFVLAEKEGKEYAEECNKKIKKCTYDISLDKYFKDVDAMEFITATCDKSYRVTYLKYILEGKNAEDAYQKMMEVHAILETPRLASWDHYDGVGCLALYILMHSEELDDSLIEAAVNVLEDVAITANRYGIQDKLKELVEEGKIKAKTVMRVYSQLKK